MGETIFEFRGVDECYIAKITEDNEENYTCSTPIKFDVQEVGKKTDSSSETHYYNNKPALVINSEGADELTLVIAPPELKVLADIMGKQFDEATGMLIDGMRKNEYFALMYRTKGTDGAYRYCVRNKGTFALPEESSKTEDSGTETTNTTLTYTGIFTKHEFKKSNGEVKGFVIDERYAKADLTNLFKTVPTVDTVAELKG
ncbi:MAG: hypothetical protein K2M46_10460 [Lachnospiraceae bacterium]|nr:hypothetical protein [Lachnospiraceae bacterium]